LQTLLAARAVGAGISTLAIVAECAITIAAAGLVSISALRLPLVLIQIAGTRLVLTGAWPVLIGPGSVLLIKVGLRAATLLRQIVRVRISELRLIVLLAEVWRGEVVRPVVDVRIIAVEVVPVNVVRVDVVAVEVIAIDIVEVRIVAVVIVVPVHKGVRVGDIHVAVVSYARVMPAASPRVIAPSAASAAAADRGSYGYTNPKEIRLVATMSPVE
jgi:hypothetical protein